jgi:hypothetical protein
MPSPGEMKNRVQNVSKLLKQVWSTWGFDISILSTLVYLKSKSI